MIPLHPRDQEWFDDYPAPIMKMLQEYHFTLCNSTIPYFGPILYFLVRQFGCEQVLEIGTAEGYSSLYLASGVKDNAIRYNMQGNHFYGLDIVQTEKTQDFLLQYKLPVTILNKDSMTLTKDTFPGVVFDLCFQDGDHSTDHVIYEFETMWPQLKDKGNGYWVAHDAEGPAWEGCKKIKQLLKERNEPHEVITLGGQYGLMIIRKMAGFDSSKNPWKD